MKNEAEIQGMYISREDMQLIVYGRYMQLSEEESEKRASELTDEQLDDIAWSFAEEFFDEREGLFATILVSAFQRLEDVK
jgi:hypothetical protein